MSTNDPLAALHRALDDEEAAAALLARAELALCEVEELAEDDPGDETLQAAISRAQDRLALAEAGFKTARERRAAIEAGLDQDEVMRAHRQRCAPAAKRTTT
jgi:hypothetical protein